MAEQQWHLIERLLVGQAGDAENALEIAKSILERITLIQGGIARIEVWSTKPLEGLVENDEDIKDLFDSY